jgi:hypothetical protein
MYLVIALRLSDFFCFSKLLVPTRKNQFKARNFPKTLRPRVGIDGIPGRQISSNIYASVPKKEYLVLTLPTGHFQTAW